MSADMSNAGAAAPPPTSAPSAPAPSTGDSASYVPGGIGSALEAALNPPQAPAPPTQTATPDAAPAAIPGMDTVTPVEAATQPPVPDTPAPVEPFAAYKTQISGLESERTALQQQVSDFQNQLQAYESIKPVIDLLESQPGSHELVSILQPALSAGLTGFDDPRAGEVGAALINAIHNHDQRLSSALINGTMKFYGNEITERALAAAGISPNDIPDYQRWKATNGVATPAFTAGKFPEPVDDGEGNLWATVPIADENGKVTYEQLDMSDPKDRRTYQYEKQNWERQQADAQRKAAEDAATAARVRADADARQQAAQQEQRQLVGSWAQTRGQAENEAYTALNPAFTGEYEWMAQASAAMAHGLMRNDDTYQQLLAAGQSAAANKEGRAAAIGERLDRIAKAHIATAVTRFSDLLKRVSGAEAATQAGKPNLPPDAPVVTPQTQILQTQTATPGQQLRPASDFPD